MVIVYSHCYSLTHSLIIIYLYRYNEITYYSPNVPFILVGTKADTRNDPEIAAQLAEKSQSLITSDQG